MIYEVCYGGKLEISCYANSINCSAYHWGYDSITSADG